jgi:hypothetical protein
MRPSWINYLTAIGGVLLSLAGKNSLANVIPIGASHDTTIFANAADNSDGGAFAIFAGTDKNSSVRRALLQFDIAGNIPAGSTITGVQLTLSLAQVAGNATTGTATIGLHRLTASWGEGITGAGQPLNGLGQGFAAGNGDATWSDRFFSSGSPTTWATAGGDSVATTSASATIGATVNTAYTWAPTAALVSDVQGWLDNPGTNDGWLLQNSDETDAQTFRAFYTREESNTALQPQLQVTFATVPEPTAALTLGLAATGLLLSRRVK